VKGDGAIVLVLEEDGRMALTGMPAGFFGSKPEWDPPTRPVDASGTWAFAEPRPSYDELVLTLRTETVNGRSARQDLGFHSARSGEGINLWFHPFDPDNPRVSLRRQ
jgi:hypothetical protein